MNDLNFRTGGSWDSTTLYNNGQEVMAAQLFVELNAGRDYDGAPTDGGVLAGAELTALVRPQDDPMNPWDILPGRLTMEFPGNIIILENSHPAVNLEDSQILLNGENVTERIVDLFVDINAVDDIASASPSTKTTGSAGTK